MPIITCPECNAALKLAESLSGKPVRCPKCKAVFATPAANAVTSAASTPAESTPAAPTKPAAPIAPRKANVSPSPDPSPFEDDEDLEEHENDDGGELEDEWAPRPSAWQERRAGPANDPEAWRGCRTGIAAALIGMLLMIVSAQAFALAKTTILLSVSVVVSALAVMGLGAVIHFLGQIACCGTPAPFNKPAVRFLVCFLLTALVVGTMIGLGRELSFRAQQNQDPPAWTYLVPIAAFLVVVPLFIATCCYWMIYLAQVAEEFGSESIAGQCKAYMVVQVLSFAIYFVTTMLTTSNLTRPRSELLDHVYAWIQVGCAVWYLFILIRLNRLIALILNRPTLSSRR